MLKYSKGWKHFKHFSTWYYSSFTYTKGGIYEDINFGGLELEHITMMGNISHGDTFSQTNENYT